MQIKFVLRNMEKKCVSSWKRMRLNLVYCYVLARFSPSAITALLCLNTNGSKSTNAFRHFSPHHLATHPPWRRNTSVSPAEFTNDPGSGQLPPKKLSPVNLKNEDIRGLTDSVSSSLDNISLILFSFSLLAISSFHRSACCHSQWARPTNLIRGYACCIEGDTAECKAVITYMHQDISTIFPFVCSILGANYKKGIPFPVIHIHSKTTILLSHSKGDIIYVAEPLCFQMSSHGAVSIFIHFRPCWPLKVWFHGGGVGGWKTCLRIKPNKSAGPQQKQIQALLISGIHERVSHTLELRFFFSSLALR